MTAYNFNADMLGILAAPDPIADVPKTVLHTAWVLDEDDRIACALSNKNPGALPLLNDLMVETLDGISTYGFDTPGNHERSGEVVNKRRVMFRDNDVTRLFVIETIDESCDEKGNQIKSVHCESATQELLGYPWAPVLYTTETPETILTALLAGTRYQVGNVEDAAAITIEWTSNTNRLQALRDLQAATTLESSSRIEVSGGRITGRYVDMVTRIGVDNGKVIAAGKDIRGITRTTDTTGLYTAMKGVGADGLTFAGVVWTYPADPADKPAGQTWVGDPDALRLYGLPPEPRTHITGTFEDSEEASATDLLTKTWNALQDAKEPAYTYDITPVWLQSMGPQVWWQDKDSYAHEVFELGDTIYVKHNDFTPEIRIETRVRELHRSFSSAATTSRVVLGTRRVLITDV